MKTKTSSYILSLIKLIRPCFLATFIFSYISIPSSYSQTLKGKVYGLTEKKGKTEKEILPGASVHWAGTATGTTTNARGVFEITIENIKDKRLVANYVGYHSDTLSVTNHSFIEFRLKGSKQLQEVVITTERPDVIIPVKEPIKTEIITQKELAKGACCDLAGCFNTNASVEPTTTNIVTNAQELRILGLSGIYNQVLIDGMPLIQGLTYTYGVSSIPGSLVDNIYVSKGANSVLQGYENISGQINVETKKPDKSEKFLLNGYMNSFFEKQLNTNYSFITGKNNKNSNLIAFHITQPAHKIDSDEDHFLDLPLLTRYMFYDKLKFNDKDSLGLHALAGLRFLKEERIGGEKNYNPGSDKGDTVVYGQYVDFYQPELYLKSGFRFNAHHAVIFNSSVFSHNQDSWFGETHYSGNQQNFNATIQYELKWRENHALKTGVSMREHDLKEKISFQQNISKKSYGGNFVSHESVTGIFAENIFRWKGDIIQFISGIRIDNHNHSGNMITPRGLLKYELNEKTNIRASIGTGWRTVNLFPENVNILASQRDIIIPVKLYPEEAVNYGTNFTHNFERENVTGNIMLDFYRTEFQNQIFPDYDSLPGKIVVNNFSGISNSNGFQAEITTRFYKVFSVKIAYNYLDVYRQKNGKKVALPFNPTDRFLSTLSYKPKSEKWHLDGNVHWYGEQKLPNTSQNPTAFRQPAQSEPYYVCNMQFTRSWEYFELYLGCENIFDFRQEKPIISWENPFGPYFDTSSAWGPTRGREWYGGVRMKF